jgi:assimilatory nitrate reductase catalytic subunit
MTVASTCPYCGVGCGVLAEGASVIGDPDHPANFGRLCVKGAALDETLGLEGRLLQPKFRGAPVSWDYALDRLGEAFGQAIARHGPDSVAFYVSGQLMTEDYYVANKLMKGFIGSGNIDTNSRLCMSSSVAGHVRAFGGDVVPGCYEDLELADLVVLVGANAAWGHPVLFQRLQAARQQRPEMKLVVIDPRRTATAQEADLHLALRPGSDVALFNGLLRHLVEHKAGDGEFIAQHSSGLPQALAALGDDLAECDLAPDDLAQFFDWFTRHERVVTVYSQGVNQSSQGTDKVNAIINCHLFTGRIGRPGMGPLSFTGQPNAMGGREVGGLANQLAAHMGFDDTAIDRVGRFWGSGRVARNPGLKAVDLFQAVESGQIKALWVMATNPAVSLPEAGRVRAALRKCDFVAVSDCVETDSTDHADLLLPALSWGEKDGTVTNSERRISRQRPFLPVPGEARADWWMIGKLAEKLGFGAEFNYAGPADIFREHARLSGFENDGRRAFDIASLAKIDYDALPPIQWPVAADGGGTARLFAGGGFFHEDRRARFIATPFKRPASVVSETFPLLLNSGRNRDQWHTMSRTGRSPRLARHAPEPVLSMHPADAAAWQLDDGKWARVTAEAGEITLPVALDPGLRQGEVFAPIHWNDRFAGNAVIGRLIADHRDALSGQPELKITPVQVTALPLFWEAMLFCRQPPAAFPPDILWSKSAATDHNIFRLAGQEPVADWRSLARSLLGDGVWIDFQDRKIGLYRAAKLTESRLDTLLLVAPVGCRPNADFAQDLFARDLDQPARRGLLAGATLNSASGRSPIICSCHAVDRQTLVTAIAAQGLRDVAAIGKILKAGTGCGSCLPELKALLPATPTTLPPRSIAR